MGFGFGFGLVEIKEAEAERLSYIGRWMEYLERGLRVRVGVDDKVSVFFSSGSCSLTLHHGKG